MDLAKYYSNKEVMRHLVKMAKDRELVVTYSDKCFGKRPDVLNFDHDVIELARSGVTSFHFSEERWSNPLLLKPGMLQKQLDDLRISWDLILDVDGPFEYSKIVAYLLVEAIKFQDVKNISVKFSGNKGFHIGIPAESFPEKIHNIETKQLFPDGPKVIAAYLKEMIKEVLTSKFLGERDVEEIANEIGKKKEDLMKDGKFDPFSIVDIDTILISNRHVFRAPYSYHEKSGLISIPINPEKILNFNKEDAKIENVKFDIGFLDNFEDNEASKLIIQAFDWDSKKKKVVKEIVKRNYEVPEKVIPEEYFPPCMNILSKGIEKDGRKRALFILMNFLKGVGYQYKEMEDYILDWNKRNYEPLKEGYVRSQLMWDKKQGKKFPPPNCPHASRENNYYIELGVCKPDNFCKTIKNPLQYAIRKSFVFGKKKKTKKK